jgi:hypothetical protein
VIEVRIDQLQRDDPMSDQTSDMLLAPHITARTVTGDQRIAAKEGAARTLEEIPRWQFPIRAARTTLQTMALRPAAEDGENAIR